MAEIDIAAIREALDEATCKGETWYKELRDPRCNFSDGSPVCMVQCDEGCVAFDIAEEDAHLIANAPAWLTQLCDAVEAKDAQIEALIGLIDDVLHELNVCSPLGDVHWVQLQERLENAVAMGEPTLIGEWRHSHGMIFCGTLRIAKADFDTNPAQEIQDKIFGEICDNMNRATMLQNKEIWDKVDKAASQVPEWMKSHLGAQLANHDKCIERIARLEAQIEALSELLDESLQYAVVPHPNHGPNTVKAFRDRARIMLAAGKQEGECDG